MFCPSRSLNCESELEFLDLFVRLKVVLTLQRFNLFCLQLCTFLFSPPIVMNSMEDKRVGAAANC